jgi:hypothetical protein
MPSFWVLPNGVQGDCARQVCNTLPTLGGEKKNKLKLSCSLALIIDDNHSQGIE